MINNNNILSIVYVLGFVVVMVFVSLVLSVVVFI